MFGSHAVTTAIAAAIVSVAAVTSAANVVAKVHTCNCYGSLVGCKQMGFLVAMHVGLAMFGFHVAWIYVPAVATAVRTVVTIVVAIDVAAAAATAAAATAAAATAAADLMQLQFQCMWL